MRMSKQKRILSHAIVYAGLILFGIWSSSVAVADEQEKCPYSPENLEKRGEPPLTVERFKKLVKKKVFLCNIELKYADLQGANLPSAFLVNSEFLLANLQRANFKNAFLYGAKLNEANLKGANFEDAYLYRAKLKEANLQGANLKNAKLDGMNISKTIFYGPECLLDKTHNATCNEEKLVFANLAGATGIKSMVYDYYSHENFPATLVPLRKHLRENGYDREATEITYFIEHGLIEEALYITGGYMENTLMNRVGAYLRYYAFDWTVEFGVNPKGAIIGIIYVLLMCTGIYFLMFWLNYLCPTWEVGVIMKVSPKAPTKTGIDIGEVIDGTYDTENMLKPVNELIRTLPPWGPDRELDFKSYWYMFKQALWFSVLSSFHFGWRDLNVGNWLTRMQPTPFTYKPTGLFRTISGIQSLLCIYLLALFVLSYFGHPWGQW